MTIQEEIYSDIKEIKNMLFTIDKELYKQHHDIYGNGKKGIITRIEDLEDNSNKINKKITYFSGSFAIITIIITYIIKFFLKI